MALIRLAWLPEEAIALLRGMTGVSQCLGTQGTGGVRNNGSCWRARYSPESLMRENSLGRWDWSRGEDSLMTLDILGFFSFLSLSPPTFVFLIFWGFRRDPAADFASFMLWAGWSRGWPSQSGFGAISGWISQECASLYVQLPPPLCSRSSCHVRASPAGSALLQSSGWLCQDGGG